MLIEYWSIERDGRCGRWMKVGFTDKAHRDRVSADMMRGDESIDCIHCQPTKPETERAKSFFSKSEASA